MEELLEALAKKSLWLHKIISVSQKFLEEVKANPDLALENLDTFDQNRESLVKMTINAENQIISIMRQQKNLTPNKEQSRKIEFYIQEYQEKLRKMRRIDSEILPILDTLKIEQKTKIYNLQKGKRALSNYRGQVKSRSNFDVQL